MTGFPGGGKLPTTTAATKMRKASVSLFLLMFVGATQGTNPAVGAELKDADWKMVEKEIEAMRAHVEEQKKKLQEWPATEKTERRMEIRVAQPRSLKNAKGEELVLEGGSVLQGTLTLERWLGPHDILEYQHPGWMKAELRCDGPGRAFACRATTWPYDLLFRKGEHVASVPPPDADIAAGAGPMQWLVDSDERRELVVEGKSITVHVKLMDTLMALHPQADGRVLVQCRFYDALNLQGFREVWYWRDAESIVFARATKLYRDAAGNVEDFDPHGEAWVDFEFAK